MSRRAIRWREGRHGKRQRKPPSGPPPEKIPIMKVVYGVSMVMLNVGVVFLLALWLGQGLRLPSALVFAALMPVTLLGFIWGPRDKVFYVMLGGIVSLWIFITILLALTGDWAARLLGLG